MTRLCALLIILIVKTSTDQLEAKNAPRVVIILLLRVVSASHSILPIRPGPYHLRIALTMGNLLSTL